MWLRHSGRWTLILEIVNIKSSFFSNVFSSKVHKQSSAYFGLDPDFQGFKSLFKIFHV